MKIQKIESMIPNIAGITAAQKTALANQVLTALQGGANEAVIAGLLIGAGVAPAEATLAAKSMKDSFDAAIEAEKKAHLARPAALFGAVMATIAVVLLAALLIIQPWEQDLSSLATGEQVEKVQVTTDNVLNGQGELIVLTSGIAEGVGQLGSGQAAILNGQGKFETGMTELKNALGKTATKDDLINATSDLATKSDVTNATADLATKDDVQTAKAELDSHMDEQDSVIIETNEIVREALTRPVRCKKDDDHPECVAKTFCKGSGKKERCYKRIAFRAASSYEAHKAAKAAKAAAAPVPADTTTTESTTDKVEDKVAPEAPAAACPAGCEQDCPEGCRPVSAPRDTTVNLELPHGSEVRVNGALL